MGTIGHGYGSEWHLLRYLGYHRERLSEYTAQLTGCWAVSWLDFGFSGTNQPLRQDAEFQGIEFIQDPAVRVQWRRFWPARAHHWDAVGIAHFNDHDEWLLVEAKAHTGELGETVGCSAIAPRSLQTIRAALLSTQLALGVEGITVDCWLRHYYQTCNRYAALHFLRNICEPAIPARLLFVYFYGETQTDWNCPQSPEEWRPALQRMEAATGICAPNPFSPYVSRLFLPVHPAVGMS